jgi:hypothetical protein
MKKTYFFYLALVIVTLLSIPARTVSAKTSGLPEQYLRMLPAGSNLPDALPTTITDPLLLTGWVYLYNQEAAINRWDGQTVSGKAIAQYIADQQVVVRWDMKNECSGSSCTPRPKCKTGLCKMFQKSANSSPILVATAYLDPARMNIAELAGTLAHESIHHMLPFGSVLDTVYEEYWAFTVGNTISGATWLDFEGYIPLKAVCLRDWVGANGLQSYNSLQLYPAAVEPSVDHASSTCPLIRALPGETSGFPSGSARQ